MTLSSLHVSADKVNSQHLSEHSLLVAQLPSLCWHLWEMWSTGTGNSRSSPCQLVRFATDCSAADPHLLLKGNTLQCVPVSGDYTRDLQHSSTLEATLRSMRLASPSLGPAALQQDAKPCWINTIQASLTRKLQQALLRAASARLATTVRVGVCDQYARNYNRRACTVTLVTTPTR